MPDYSLRLPAWTVGSRALDAIREVIPAGKKAAVIGGNKGMAAIRPRLKKAAEGWVSLLGFLWYGGEASEENIRRLAAEDAVRQADIRNDVRAFRLILQMLSAALRLYFC